MFLMVLLRVPPILTDPYGGITWFTTNPPVSSISGLVRLTRTASTNLWQVATTTQ